MNHSIYKITAWIYACTCLCSNLQAQNIPNEANSIVIDAKTEITCQSMTQFLEKESRTITILNKKGLESALFYCGCDMFRSLQKFSGEIFNTSGQSVRKIKKSELQKSEYSSSLTTDNYFYIYECNYPSFPFTIKYEWEIKCNNGIIGYSPFVPQNKFNMGVEYATYRIELPTGQKCRHYVTNNQRNEIQVKEFTGPKGQQIIEATATKMLPQLNEPFRPEMAELFPCVHFAPSTFIFSKSEGDMSTWQKYGEWQYKLLDGRDVLDEPIRNKLHELTATCRTDREKVKVIYDYLAKTTRYVSIQLGIGGLQPIPAADVCHTGFGDCKGLSNYACAMLKEVGIPSTYTVISTDNKHLLSKFSSANQMNHVILQVPLPKDTLWLECTNPLLPFGYVHQSIAGHDALLIEPTGGRIYRLPTYPDSLNTQCISANVALSPLAEAKIEVHETSRLFLYENQIGILYQEPNKQKEHIRSTINLSQADILNLQISECKDTHPSITFNYKINSHQYGQKTKNRLFIPTNVFRRTFNVPHFSKRICPIQIENGYSNTDSICFQLPEEYTIEGLSHPVNLKSKFGTFHSSVDINGDKILVIHRLFMPKGIYAPEEYAAFLAFRSQIAEQYNGSIILKKN